MLSQSSLDKLNELSPEQKQVAIKILKDTLENNKSSTFNELLETDYEEIPVDIDTFLTDRRYLGEFTNGGANLTYRKWPEALREWFPNPLAPSPYIEIALTGAIGLGKSTNFDFAMAYFLYKLMCLKDPNAYYGQPGSTLWFCFFNNTLNSANSAAYGKFQSMLKSSSWFMERGTLSGIKNPEYIPNKNIRFMVGSTLQHTLGINIIAACLTGDTTILTEYGYKTLKELEGKQFKVYSLNNSGNKILSNITTCIETKKVNKLLEIYLENNEIIKCTLDHRLMIENNIYKQAKDLTTKDILQCYNNKVKISSIKEIKLDQYIPVYDIINALPYHNFFIKSGNRLVVSHNCLDEVNFGKGKDVSLEQNKLFTMYSIILERISSRFMVNGRSAGMMFLASSKQSQHDFLEKYIERKDAENKRKPKDKRTFYKFDYPQWEVHPASKYPSGKYFKVACQNVVLPNKLIEPEEETPELIKELEIKGYRIISVPMELYDSAKMSLDTFLMNTAGIASTLASKYLHLSLYIDNEYQHIETPFEKEVLEIGLKDKLRILDFFNPKILRRFSYS